MSSSILRIRAVVSRTGRSRSSIYADMQNGYFPIPVKIGPRAVGWVEAEIEAWITDQIAKTRQAPHGTR